jgi:Protein of unknown function (DUF3239)
MATTVQCSCGKTLRVKDEALGKRIRCPGCGKAVAVPGPEADSRVDSELDLYRRLSGSAASNPGQLSPNLFQYFLCFPTFSLVCFVIILLAAALAALVHFLFAVVAVLTALLLGWYWFRVRIKFISGCVNPAVVVSEDPPLLAVGTDLACGSGVNWPVIKILAHPFGRMFGGPFREGDRVPTVALYYGEDGPHWLDFEPVAAQCVTRNRDEIARMLESIDDAGWKVLELGLRQIPQPLEPGQYRLIPNAERTPAPRMEELEIALKRHLKPNPEKGRYGPKDRVAKELFSGVVAGCDAEVQEKEVIAAVASETKSQGVLLTMRSVLYHLGKDESGEVEWANLRGAALHFDEVELVTGNQERHRFSRNAFSSENQWLLEQAINAAVGTTGTPT